MSTTIPSYRRRPGYSQALVTLTDSHTKKRRDYWLGEHNSPQSRETYHRLVAEWESRGRRLPPSFKPASTERVLTINELCLEYWRHARNYYETKASGHIRCVIRLTRSLYGSSAAATFGPKALQHVRDAMIRGDPTSSPPRKPWSRRYINSQIQRLRRIFKWAASNELLPASVFHQIQTVPSLRRGRCGAADPEPVRPASIELVNAVRPFLSRQVNALVDLQLLTGARGGELFGLRPVDLEMDGGSGVWTVALQDHKTSHYGHQRTIYLGPKAQGVIRPFLSGRIPDATLFSPVEAEEERRAARTVRRRTPLSCGNVTGSNRSRDPKRGPGSRYTADSYRRAITYACDKAFPVPGGLDETEIDQWRRDHRWHPHQLRHTAATLIRREFGLEAARIALGHSSALVTDAVYAERDMDKVVEVMRKIG
jgi:integrase